MHGYSWHTARRGLSNHNRLLPPAGTDRVGKVLWVVNAQNQRMPFLSLLAPLVPSESVCAARNPKLRDTILTIGLRNGYDIVLPVTRDEMRTFTEVVVVAGTNVLCPYPWAPDYMQWMPLDAATDDAAVRLYMDFSMNAMK